MSIEIIKPGIRPEEQRYHATCRRCRCEFTFQRSDAELVPDQRDGDFFRIDCPACTWDVTVSAKPLPRGGSSVSK